MVVVVVGGILSSVVMDVDPSFGKDRVVDKEEEEEEEEKFFSV